MPSDEGGGRAPLDVYRCLILCWIFHWTPGNSSNTARHRMSRFFADAKKRGLSVAKQEGDGQILANVEAQYHSSHPRASYMAPRLSLGSAANAVAAISRR